MSRASTRGASATGEAEAEVESEAALEVEDDWNGEEEEDEDTWPACEATAPRRDGKGCKERIGHIVIKRVWL